jgi:3-hydroxyacyl-[acyl-carrier-protein] dehydratase
VVSLREGESGEALWNLTGEEAFFAGHFPGRPVVPGVLIAEALAQWSGIVGSAGEHAGKLAQVDVRFDRAVTPPADILLYSKLLRTMGPLRQFEVTASVGNQVVARGELTIRYE